MSKLREFHVQSLGGCLLQIMDVRQEISNPTQEIIRLREISPLEPTLLEEAAEILKRQMDWIADAEPGYDGVRLMRDANNWLVKLEMLGIKNAAT